MKKAKSQAAGRTGSARNGAANNTGSPSKASAKGKAAKTSTTSKLPASTNSSSNGRGVQSTIAKPSGDGNRPSTSGRTAKGQSKAAATHAPRRSMPGAVPSKAPARSKKKSMTPREGLTDVLKDCLKDIFYAEKQLAKALKKMSKAATDPSLRDAFTTHMQQTEAQIELLAGAFEEMGLKVQGKKCPAMDGLIEESSEHIEEMDKGSALDAALIVGAQKVEHYEIAAYGSMRTFAQDLGLEESARIFDQILQQESETDELLMQIAQTVNRNALAEDEDTEKQEDNGSAMNWDEMANASKDGMALNKR